MRIWQRWMISMALVLLALGAAGQALAISVSGRSSTELEWYDSGKGDTALPGYEYLLLNVRDIDGNGLNFRGYGRLGMDFKNAVNRADSRLYYGYLEKRNLVKNLDIKLGRQFISTTAGASLMDGLYLDYNHLGPLRVSLFGGGDVAYYGGYNAQDLIGGLRVSGKFFKTLNVGVSYLQRWNDGQLANEMFGLNFDYDWAKMLELYSEVQVDYLSNCVSYFVGGANYHRSNCVSYFVGGANYHRSNTWNLRLEYLYSLPVFSATSIYSVFAADEYQQLMAEYSTRFGEGLRAFGRGTWEMYKDNFDDAYVFEAGVEKIRTERWAGYLSGVWREDPDGQDMKGFKINGSYLFQKFLQAGAGVEVNVLQRRLEENSDDTTASRFWVDATAYVTKKINVQAKVERVKSDLWDYYNRGRVRLNVLF